MLTGSLCWVSWEEICARREFRFKVKDGARPFEQRSPADLQPTLPRLLLEVAALRQLLEDNEVLQVEPQKVRKAPAASPTCQNEVPAYPSAVAAGVRLIERRMAMAGKRYDFSNFGFESS
ncbi:unnamed protein product [Durusdinium trenchii]|uniref:Uncharacterized protein n=1 Tax=Durusdinium trenchii TaxID=1381693 RepID=A0ABP0H9U6_9DINO